MKPLERSLAKRKKGAFGSLVTGAILEKKVAEFFLFLLITNPRNCEKS
jgi:hypothetical protein